MIKSLFILHGISLFIFWLIVWSNTLHWEIRTTQDVTYRLQAASRPLVIMEGDYHSIAVVREDEVWMEVTDEPDTER